MLAVRVARRCRPIQTSQIFPRCRVAIAQARVQAMGRLKKRFAGVYRPLVALASGLKKRGC